MVTEGKSKEQGTRMIVPEAEINGAQKEFIAILDQIKNGNPEMAADIEYGKTRILEAIGLVRWWMEFAQAHEQRFAEFQVAMLWTRIHLDKIRSVTHTLQIRELEMKIERLGPSETNAERKKQARDAVLEALSEINEISEQLQSKSSPKPADARLAV